MKTQIILILFLLIAAGAQGYANVFHDSTDRKYMRIQRNFMADIPASVTPFSCKTSLSTLRGYGLQNERMVCLYFVNGVNQTAPLTGHADTLTAPFDSGAGFWIDPSTGDTISKFTTGAGTQILPIPDFTADIAAKIFAVAGIHVEDPGAVAVDETVVRPNPFNPSTSISFRVKAGRENQRVSVRIFDTRGKLVRTLAHETMKPGYKKISWDGKDESGVNISSGLYVCRIQAGAQRIDRKLALVR